MPRPPFHLTDQQAARIAQGVMELDTRIPVDTRSHRPFVREFIQLVHATTGKLYSPEIYRRLLDAYAPARRPSMSTLAEEREHAGRTLTAALAPVLGENAAPGPLQAAPPSDIAERVADAVEARLGRSLDAVAQQQNAQLDFYLHQLQQAEAELKALRAHIATLVGQLAEARQSAEQYRADAEAGRALIAQHVQSVAVLSQSADDMRKFALMSIEEARGEARELKDRCVELELQQHRDAQALDALRRANFRAATNAGLENDK